MRESLHLSRGVLLIPCVVGVGYLCYVGCNGFIVQVIGI